MKKIFIILGIACALLIVTIIAIPIIFKDDIRQAMDQAMDESLNAKVFYDTDQFGLSLLKKFPDFTVSIGDFGIVGIEEFEKDTLVSVGNFQITIDLMSAISGDQIKINEVLLNEPKISILVLKSGKANYDIAKEGETEEENDEGGTGDVSVGIEKWEISDGQLVYNDQSMNFYTTLMGLNHEGSGDFSLDVFDMKTQTNIESVSLGYGGEEFISKKRLSADVTLNMNLAEMKFLFKENRIAINEFAVSADGFISLPSDDIDMDISFGGKDIGLKSILSLIPGTYQKYLDGVDASGAIAFDGYVRGTFNEVSMPKIVANLSVKNGKVIYADYPMPMEGIEIKSSFTYPSSDLRETSFNVDKFHMLLDGEEISAYLKFKNLENYTWDLGIDGNADLEKITKIIPLEGMELKGKINAKLNTSGKMSDVEAERYGQLPTAGSLNIKNFLFTSEDVPQGFGIQSANLHFNPSEINLSEFQATAGASDLNLKGKVTNYLAFALGEEETLIGHLEFNSKKMNLNEWMATDEEPVEAEEETDEVAPLEVIKIPENIDFLLQSNIAQINYTNLSLEEFQGRILVQDGAIILEQNSFKMLDGTFELAGSYMTKGLEKPKYDFSFKIKELSISDAFNAFETVQAYVPIAKQVSGKFSTNIKVDGTLGQDMMPLMDEINLSGRVNIAEALLEKGDFLNKVSSVANLKIMKIKGLNDTKKSISVRDVSISTTIRNGRLHVKPFDLQVNGQKATLGGSNSLDGGLDYALSVKDIPTGAIGNALNSALGSVTGGKKIISDKIDLNLGIVGTYDNPKVQLLGSNPSSGSGTFGGVKAALKEQIAAKVDEQKAKMEAELAKQKVEAEAKLVAEKKKAEAKVKAELNAKKKAAAVAVKRKLEEERKKAAKATKDKVKNLFKKKGGGN